MEALPSLLFHERLHEQRDGMLYMSVRAISATVNLNYDGWPAEELEKAHKTFIDSPIYVDHNSEDLERTRGRILDSQYCEAIDDEGEIDQWIELLLEIDAQSFPMLAEEIVNEGIDSVSMGCDVSETECSICGNIALDESEFCPHIAYMKGESLNGQLVYEICRGISFYEISLVFDPADTSALAKRVVFTKQAASWNYTPHYETVDLNGKNVEDQPPVEAFPFSYSNEENPDLDQLFKINPYVTINELL